MRTLPAPRAVARLLAPALLLLLFSNAVAQPRPDSLRKAAQQQLLYTVDFLDAAVNSLNAINSLLRKEAYRVRITSFNNPASSDLGFNLDQEVQTALKPLLDKTRSTDPQKFSSVVTSLLLGSGKSLLGNPGGSVTGVLPTLMSLVGNLAVQEKRITRDDLDSFLAVTGRYFAQFEKLHAANDSFEGSLGRLDTRMHDLQFDLREYELDLCALLYPDVPRASLRALSDEELLLRYLNRDRLAARWAAAPPPATLRYPSDAIKTAKDLSGNLQKLFADYQKIYSENYQQVRGILNDTRQLGKRINTQQLDLSLKEVEELYTASRSSDGLGLRLGTLQERLRLLSAAEQSVQPVP
ncbi:hypothetical protein [Flaviaesturariibacter terrae]